jgi:hypothetical protein
MMQYQLVLQWPASSIDDYDAMIETENLLIDSLPKGSEIDGHDAGSGEVNIFMTTDDPRRTFETVKLTLESHGRFAGVRVGYRNVEATKYSVLWPEGLEAFKVS